MRRTREELLEKLAEQANNLVEEIEREELQSAKKTVHSIWETVRWALIHKKEKVCAACNGSGYYDSHGSPPCGACNGTGKEEEF